jgi:DNA-binding XRE family transcriptional regulator
MPNIGAVLREEITRLSRRESRSQIDPTKRATAQYRREIALLKRRVSQLEHQVKQLLRRTSGSALTPSSDVPARRLRFVAKGLRSQRNRLGLSAGEFGSLIGVSAQTIYNWEGESTTPRNEQLIKLAALREIGKREAHERLTQLAAGKTRSRRKG